MSARNHWPREAPVVSARGFFRLKVGVIVDYQPGKIYPFAVLCENQLIRNYCAYELLARTPFAKALLAIDSEGTKS